MTDAISSTTPQVGEARARPKLYQAEGVREVQARARFIEQQQSEKERAGVQRLDSLLSVDNGPDQNVPRGFYLNIEV